MQAATISAAVSSVIEAITDREELVITLAFLYALLGAQLIGYAVIFLIPSTSVRIHSYSLCLLGSFD